jgi:hypothetical protein
MGHMVITCRRFGRLGNRLFLYSHLIAFSEYAGIPILNPAFSEFCRDFPFFSDQRVCPYGLDASWKKGFLDSAITTRLAASLGAIPTVRFWDDHNIVFDGEDASDPRIGIMKESSRVLFEGWRFRSQSYILNLVPRIRAVFAPRDEIQGDVARRCSEARQRGDILVGVHVRWEDYRGTEQFFPLPVFLERMKEISAILGPGGISFVICSPETIRREDFPSNCIFDTKSGAVADMYTLAACDYILGPPSTFSGWASFYGGKPVFTMRRDVPFTELSAAETWRW